MSLVAVSSAPRPKPASNGPKISFSAVVYPTAPSSAAAAGTVVTEGTVAVEIVPLIRPVAASNDSEVAASAGVGSAETHAAASAARDPAREAEEECMSKNARVGFGCAETQ